MTLFAFDQDQGLSPHKTLYDALVYLIDGEAMITIGKKENYLRKGDMIYMPANTTHALKASQRFKMLLVMIKTL